MAGLQELGWNCSLPPGWAYCLLFYRMGVHRSALCDRLNSMRAYMTSRCWSCSVFCWLIPLLCTALLCCRWQTGECGAGLWLLPQLSCTACRSFSSVQPMLAPQLSTCCCLTTHPRAAAAGPKLMLASELPNAAPTGWQGPPEPCRCAACPPPPMHTSRSGAAGALPWECAPPGLALPPSCLPGWKCEGSNRISEVHEGQRLPGLG